MFARTQARLKSWILKKSIQKLERRVALSTIVSTQFSNKIQKPLKRFGIMPMTGSVISEPIRRLTVATSVTSKGTSHQPNGASPAQTVAIVIPKTVDVVKRTCGYLGNPQARPMVNGRHKEIAARVKHMNGSTIKYGGHEVKE